MVGNLALHIAEWYNDDREYGAVAPRLSFVGSYYIHAHTVRLRLAVCTWLTGRYVATRHSVRWGIVNLLGKWAMV